jgi:isoleucyl-tRNA synthetase
MNRDYKETITLPTTSFSIAGVDDEARLIRDFITPAYAEMATNEDNFLPFVLHDGPPYANGDIHMGHAFNKILKDIIVRSKFSLGQTVRFVPGWDCHGLPIEWQVERNLMEEGKNKSDFSVMEFRQLCRDYAYGWIDRQRTQFKSLAVGADWDKPYLSMTNGNEAKIVANLHTLLSEGALYRGTKPVLWSAVEETALAEAEVEYEDLRVSSIYVKFGVVGNPTCSVLIWTTTPWTLPANKAVAFNPDIEYGVYKVTSPSPKVELGEMLAVAKKLAQQTFDAIGVSAEWVSDWSPTSLYHPLSGATVPMIPGAHVTDDDGTGFVHTAPEHGPDDFICWAANGGGEVETTIGPDGAFLDGPYKGLKVLQPTPKGNYIFEFANAKIIADLEARGTLAAVAKITVRYPHSWRSHAPLFFRNTPQWFMSLGEETNARQSVLEDIDEIVKFLPESASKRLRASIETRPDWLLSRQRVWGTPMALFLHKETGEPLVDDAVNARINYIFRYEGGDAWWKYDTAHFFSGTSNNPDDYDKVMDVLDVWFDSGCSFSFDEINAASHPADMVVEGSDQHRGWFGSSALCGVTLTGMVPYNSVLSHGFVLDKNGIKMSKSKGNVVDPLAMSQKYGTDVIRLWAAMTDYTQDMRVGDEILKGVASQYKKLRNTLRFMVSNLQGFRPDNAPSSIGPCPRLEFAMRDKLAELSDTMVKLYRDHRFNDVIKTLLDFCSNDLSAFYFDIRKDVLYCSRPDSSERYWCLLTLEHCFHGLLIWLAPILPLTTEEAMQTLNNGGSNVLRRMYGLKTLFQGIHGTPDTALKDLAMVREVLGHVNEALEVERQNKVIGSALEANVIVQLNDEYRRAFEGFDPAEIFRTSQASISRFLSHETNTIRITVRKAEGQRCARSWKILPDVGSDPRYPELSSRDADAVAYWDAIHQ